MPVTEITSLKDFREIIDSGKPVVVDFWATWCGPCRVISPIFEKFSEEAEFAGVEFYKVDVDKADDISKEVGIRAMPTFMLFQGGDKKDELVGAVPQKLKELVSQASKLL